MLDTIDQEILPILTRPNPRVIGIGKLEFDFTLKIAKESTRKYQLHVDCDRLNAALSTLDLVGNDTWGRNCATQSLDRKRALRDILYANAVLP